MSGDVRRGRVRTVRMSFRQWRRSRPFWAGVFTLSAALVLLYPPYASLKFGDVVITLKTLGGISALVVGVVMIICAVSFWIRPQFRMASGIVTLLLAVVAIVTVNLGSMFLGTLLGIIGAALGLAWSPAPKQWRTVTSTQAGTRAETRAEHVSAPRVESAHGAHGGRE
ncbi:hypothetical protein DFQ14_10316 [Halopolyspora algeriensis]|uniref:Uncharacterized protein n=1 Tax=Halopolyspora algeriensis TaxID=1500506 RepID=A0A368VTI3_9ACTN|nr:DUF6114 domain-containing protein [Halopolyspora algeriensis]RCW45055.1 hypothetical protein DFQ14_10316 [Halopolyspora algeriensis]TQM53220.1 hypothetical protein FHU43_2606 [Halopolyspora algeriensis]